MKRWTKDLLEDNGYYIKNAKIVSANVCIRGGELFLHLKLEGDGWGCDFGCSNLGWASYRNTSSLIDLHTQFTGLSGGSLYIISLLTILGVSSVNDLIGMYVRVASKDRLIKIIGNIVHDFWFDEVSFWDDPDMSSTLILNFSDVIETEGGVE